MNYNGSDARKIPRIFINKNLGMSRVSLVATTAAKADDPVVMDIIRTTITKYCPHQYCDRCDKIGPLDKYDCYYFDKQIDIFKSDKISVIKVKNRDINFRGKRLDNKEWVTGSLVRINGRDFIFPDPEPEGFPRFEVDRATVGQYTGLKDASGKDIWEGDILFTPAHNLFARIVGPVFYEEDAFFVNDRDNTERYRLSWIISKPSTRKVGNIYDNPELI